MEETKHTPADATPIDQRYHIVVAFLLVVILGSLSILWMRERSRRIGLEVQASQLTQENSRLRAVLTQSILDRETNQPTTQRGQ